jgi:hypothetical protein
MIFLLFIIAIVVCGLLLREALFPQVLSLSLIFLLLIVALRHLFLPGDVLAITMASIYLACEFAICLFILPGRKIRILAGRSIGINSDVESSVLKNKEWLRITRFALLPSLVIVSVFLLWYKFSGHAFMNVAGSVKTVHLLLLSACLAFGTSTAGAAFALWLQDYSLRKKKSFFNGALVPSVTISDLSAYRLVGGTFILLTLAFVPALFMVRSHWGGWHWEIRTVGGLLLWLSYGLAFHLRKKAQLNGVKFALLPLVALVIFLSVMFFTGGGMK